MTEHSQPEYDVVIQRNRAVPMRDGVRLATDVYLPARDGIPIDIAFPTILTRTPYDKGPKSVILDGEWWARRGYARVIQDVRGRFASEGDFYLLKNEAEDGYDTVEWLAEQPWCDGQVGMVGTSYLAWVQSAAATQNPPHLAAMWVNQGAFNGLSSSLRQGGAIELRWLAWAFWNAPVSPEAEADPVLYEALDRAAVDLRAWLARLPWRPGDTPLALTQGLRALGHRPAHPGDRAGLALAAPEHELRALHRPDRRRADGLQRRLVRLLHPRHHRVLRRLQRTPRRRRSTC